MASDELAGIYKSQGAYEQLSGLIFEFNKIAEGQKGESDGEV
jgi:hypothetical protein